MQENPGQTGSSFGRSCNWESSPRQREMAGEPARYVTPQRVELRRRHVARPREVDAEIAVDPARPGAHHKDAIRQQHGFLDRMGDENGGDAGALPYLQQFVLKLLAGQRVQRAEGL